MDPVRNYFNRPWNPRVMEDAAPLLDVVHTHLQTVYWTLCATAVVSSFGAYSYQIHNIGGWIATLIFVASIILLSKIQPWWQNSRLMLLLTAAYCFGASIGPLINFIVVVDQSDIVKVFVGASFFFYCYLVSVFSGPQRVVIYRGADFLVTILVPTWMVLYQTSIVTIPGYVLGILHFLWIVEVSIRSLYRPRFMIWFDISIQVAWFCFLRYHFSFNLGDLGLTYLALWPLKIYMVAHSQESIHRAGHGENDFVSHTIAFFTDFPALTAPRHMAGVMLRNIWGFLRHG